MPKQLYPLFVCFLSFPQLTHSSLYRTSCPCLWPTLRPGTTASVRIDWSPSGREWWASSTGRTGCRAGGTGDRSDCRLWTCPRGTLASVSGVSTAPLAWKEMFYLTTHSTHFIYGTGDRSDCHSRRCPRGTLASVSGVSTAPLAWKEMFYLMTHVTHFIYSYMASDIWLRTNLIAKEGRKCFI